MVKKKKLWSWPNYDQEFYGSINSEGGSMWKFWGHASSAPPMVVNAVQWGSPFTFYSKSDTFYSCVFIVISHSHFLAGTWFETGGGLRLVVCLTVTSSELWWSVSTPEAAVRGWHNSIVDAWLNWTGNCFTTDMVSVIWLYVVGVVRWTWHSILSITVIE